MVNPSTIHTYSLVSFGVSKCGEYETVSSSYFDIVYSFLSGKQKTRETYGNGYIFVTMCYFDELATELEPQIHVDIVTGMVSGLFRNHSVGCGL